MKTYPPPCTFPSITLLLDHPWSLGQKKATQNFERWSSNRVIEANVQGGSDFHVSSTIHIFKLKYLRHFHKCKVYNSVWILVFIMHSYINLGYLWKDTCIVWLSNWWELKISRGVIGHALHCLESTDSNSIGSQFKVVACSSVQCYLLP